MRRSALYSRGRPAAESGPGVDSVASGPPDVPPRPSRFRRFLSRWPRAASALSGALAVGLLAVLIVALNPSQYKITQEDIDAAVLNALESVVPPSPAVKAYEAIRPSVVRVVGYRKSKDGETEGAQGVGTGVVVIDKGVILTNLHVVQSADHVKLVFADGLESSASLVVARPEHDLAVLQAHTIPDDLQAATMRSSGDLAPGDHVFAVGFPFGIGPSVSAGIVSGLNRDYASPEDKKVLSNLIQFDAAANPGNSGGPLITVDGEVVGIVTAILNPTDQAVFIGIGFAVPIENAATAAGTPPF
ncbi:MAG: peptidase S1 [Burkholderiales bacterium RIFCSPLOWO2_02_FULL_57_36]|nr:MAG: peptidase S1 [Burkholderiales bacterium RIFCSPLOWO2_02_FULL_57_36]